MNAVFIHKAAVLRDSHIDPDTDPSTWRLVPATLEALRLLSSDDSLLFIYDAHCMAVPPEGDEEDVHQLRRLVQEIESGGGTVDGLIVCPHDEEAPCTCWGAEPGILWVAGSQFSLHLENCFVLGDSERDVDTSFGAGTRPMLVLGERTAKDVQSDRPPHKNYPLVRNLTMAVEYIRIENQTTNELGHAPEGTCAIPPADELYAHPEALPALTVLSRRAHGLQSSLRKSRLELRDLARWLSFFVAGALGLSLGIAYLLTHLYRQAAFPDFAYYLTLQFISRPVRGALFIVVGFVVLMVAVRSFYRSANIFRRLTR